MKLLTLIYSFLSCLFLAGCQEKVIQPVQSYEPAFSFLTTGGASKGREAFSDLKCGACHKVAGDSAFQSPTMTGPELGSLQSKLSANAIADSIVAPSHGISTGVQTTSVSPMGDYSKVMTVRQLTDLVAFVKALPE